MENEIEKTHLEDFDAPSNDASYSKPDNAMKPTEGKDAGEPAFESVYKYLMFGLSLPERTIRSTAAMVGGAVHESAALLVPQAFQDSKTYNTFVQQMLDVLNKEVGGVGQGAEDETNKESTENENQDPEVENYVAKKTVSTFVDLAGMATLHVSPMTILAIVSDVAYGSRTYLNELADELKREGVISEDSSISNVAELIEAVGNASGQSADALDMPPVSVEGLQETYEKTKDSLIGIDPSKLIPQSEIDRLWTDMHTMAAKEGVNFFEISSAMTLYTLDHVTTVSKGALTTVRVTGELVNRHLFDHYREGLQDIAERGIYAMLADSSKPYLDAVWFNFSYERPTITEDIVSGKMMHRAWMGVKGWFGGDEES